MSWTYSQSTGTLLHNGIHIGVGYSGHGPGVNHSESEKIHDIGPIPRGTWRIEKPIDSSHTGPFSLPLVLISGDAFGRSAFLIHGDNQHMDFSASHGCIIMARPIRKQIIDSGDCILEVIA